MDLKGRNFLTLLDFTPEEIDSLLDLAARLKAEKKAGVPHKIHAGKNIALIFEKTSTPAALRWQHPTLVCTRYILIRMLRRSGKRRA